MDVSSSPTRAISSAGLVPGAATSGDMTGLDGKYDKEDIVNFGDFVPVPCPRGAVRITMPAIAHGSTANNRGTKRSTL